MAISREHDLHRRRFGRNAGVGLVLAALVALMFGLTVVKMTDTGPVPAYDHTVRPQLLPEAGQ